MRLFPSCFHAKVSKESKYCAKMYFLYQKLKKKLAKRRKRGVINLARKGGLENAVVRLTIQDHFDPGMNQSGA
jgi:hypothetical protein